MKTLTLFVKALRLSFTESDSTVAESDGSATVTITKSELSQGRVTCTLLPLSLEQARTQFGYNLIDGSHDPAEIGT